MPFAVQADPASESAASNAVDMELLLFLGDAVEVDGEWLDALELQERDTGKSTASASSTSQTSSTTHTTITTQTTSKSANQQEASHD
ncbi:hypothetical protein [Parathalassolituus penaei]|uniref:Uncharacterized protein n=1 Tax=Parathalassolituus penaei TaxID=2997323 RepID=A0A9X3EHN3_9GAMM|nr:hypothetical protein [Parathalassolituus penaei]MCY0966910.1 hypothetical protein [Parathalassolituus penaei]